MEKAEEIATLYDRPQCYPPAKRLAVKEPMRRSTDESANAAALLVSAARTMVCFSEVMGFSLCAGQNRHGVNSESPKS